MRILVVQVHVKAECVEAFRAATIENARNSVLEQGMARFDIAAQVDDPTRFVLIEVYRSIEATTAHKETAHYKAWRAAVEPMMAEPRVGTWHTQISPEGEG
jgi:quinol monooxygenase YgiN